MRPQDVLPFIEDALRDCDFVAIDCEMSGLNDGNLVEDFLDDVEDRYTKARGPPLADGDGSRDTSCLPILARQMAASASKFIVTQLGVSCFVWSDGAYRAQTFNINTFPRHESHVGSSNGTSRHA